MTTYRVEVTRASTAWAVYVPELDRWTQARHLREVDTMARDLVAVMTDVEPDSFELDVTIETPAEVAEHLRRAEELRGQEAEARRAAAAELREAARALRDAGMPLRDVGEVLGVSYQRAHQLVDVA